MLEANNKLLQNNKGNDERQLHRERSHGKSNLQICSNCSGLYQRRKMSQHKLQRLASTAMIIVA